MHVHVCECTDTACVDSIVQCTHTHITVIESICHLPVNQYTSHVVLNYTTSFAHVKSILEVHCNVEYLLVIIMLFLSLSESKTCP